MNCDRLIVNYEIWTGSQESPFLPPFKILAPSLPGKDDKQEKGIGSNVVLVSARFSKHNRQLSVNSNNLVK
jgi:hypothetical protein